VPGNLGTVGTEDVQVHPWFVQMLEQPVFVPVRLREPVHVLESLEIGDIGRLVGGIRHR